MINKQLITQINLTSIHLQWNIWLRSSIINLQKETQQNSIDIIELFYTRYFFISLLVDTIESENIKNKKQKTTRARTAHKPALLSELKRAAMTRENHPDGDFSDLSIRTYCEHDRQTSRALRVLTPRKEESRVHRAPCLWFLLAKQKKLARRGDSRHFKSRYAAYNRKTEITTEGSTEVVNKTYNYNDRNQVTQVTDSVSAEQSTYTYDNNGNRLTKTVIPANAGIQELVFNYDVRDQLRNITQGGSSIGQFLYDD